MYRVYSPGMRWVLCGHTEKAEDKWAMANMPLRMMLHLTERGQGVVLTYGTYWAW